MSDQPPPLEGPPVPLSVVPHPHRHAQALLDAVSSAASPVESSPHPATRSGGTSSTKGEEGHAVHSAPDADACIAKVGHPFAPASTSASSSSPPVVACALMAAGNSPSRHHECGDERGGAHEGGPLAVEVEARPSPPSAASPPPAEVCARSPAAIVAAVDQGEGAGGHGYGEEGGSNDEEEDHPHAAKDGRDVLAEEDGTVSEAISNANQPSTASNMCISPQSNVDGSAAALAVASSTAGDDTTSNTTSNTTSRSAGSRSNNNKTMRFRNGGGLAKGSSGDDSSSRQGGGGTTDGGGTQTSSSKASASTTAMNSTTTSQSMAGGRASARASAGGSVSGTSGSKGSGPAAITSSNSFVTISSGTTAKRTATTDGTSSFEGKTLASNTTMTTTQSRSLQGVSDSAGGTTTTPTTSSVGGDGGRAFFGEPSAHLRFHHNHHRHSGTDGGSQHNGGNPHASGSSDANNNIKQHRHTGSIIRGRPADTTPDGGAPLPAVTTPNHTCTHRANAANSANAANGRAVSSDGQMNWVSSSTLVCVSPIDAGGGTGVGVGRSGEKSSAHNPSLLTNNNTLDAMGSNSNAPLAAADGGHHAHTHHRAASSSPVGGGGPRGRLVNHHHHHQHQHAHAAANPSNHHHHHHHDTNTTPTRARRDDRSSARHRGGGADPRYVRSRSRQHDGHTDDDDVTGDSPCPPVVDTTHAYGRSMPKYAPMRLSPTRRAELLGASAAYHHSHLTGGAAGAGAGGGGGGGLGSTASDVGGVANQSTASRSGAGGSGEGSASARRRSPSPTNDHRHRHEHHRHRGGSGTPRNLSNPQLRMLVEDGITPDGAAAKLLSSLTVGPSSSHPREHHRKRGRQRGGAADGDRRDEGQAPTPRTSASAEGGGGDAHPAVGAGTVTVTGTTTRRDTALRSADAVITDRAGAAAGLSLMGAPPDGGMAATLSGASGGVVCAFASSSAASSSCAGNYSGAVPLRIRNDILPVTDTLLGVAHGGLPTVMAVADHPMATVAAAVGFTGDDKGNPLPVPNLGYSCSSSSTSRGLQGVVGIHRHHCMHPHHRQRQHCSSTSDGGESAPTSLLSIAGGASVDAHRHNHLSHMGGQCEHNMSASQRAQLQRERSSNQPRLNHRDAAGGVVADSGSQSDEHLHALERRHRDPTAAAPAAPAARRAVPTNSATTATTMTSTSATTMTTATASSSQSIGAARHDCEESYSLFPRLLESFIYRGFYCKHLTLRGDYEDDRIHTHVQAPTATTATTTHNGNNSSNASGGSAPSMRQGPPSTPQEGSEGRASAMSGASNARGGGAGGRSTGYTSSSNANLTPYSASLFGGSNGSANRGTTPVLVLDPADRDYLRDLVTTMGPGGVGMLGALNPTPPSPHTAGHKRVGSGSAAGSNLPLYPTTTGGGGTAVSTPNRRAVSSSPSGGPQPPSQPLYSSNGFSPSPTAVATNPHLAGASAMTLSRTILQLAQNQRASVTVLRAMRDPSNVPAQQAANDLPCQSFSFLHNPYDLTPPQLKAMVPSHYLCFYATEVPAMPINAYIAFLYRQQPIGAEVFLLAMCVLWRVSRRLPVCSRSLHRMLLTAVVLCQKSRGESPYILSYYASMGGVGAADLGVMERAMLAVLRHDLYGSQTTRLYVDMVYSLRVHCQISAALLKEDWVAGAWSEVTRSLPIPCLDGFEREQRVEMAVVMAADRARLTRRRSLNAVAAIKPERAERSTGERRKSSRGASSGRGRANPPSASSFHHNLNCPAHDLVQGWVASSANSLTIPPTPPLLAGGGAGDAAGYE